MAAGHRVLLALAFVECAPPPATDARDAPAESKPAAREPSQPAAELARASALEGLEIVAQRSLRRSVLILARDDTGRGHFVIEPPGGPAESIRCDDRLEGAWGLWVDDVDGDGNAEAVVALHKRAHFDERLANRLHVYGFEDDRCVPAWRGTRLAGRFDGAATDPDDHGALLVHEWLSPKRRRVARYRWHGFGYRVESVPWEGSDSPPTELVADLDFGPSPVDSPKPKDP